MDDPAQFGAPDRADFTRTGADLERCRNGDADGFASLWRRIRPGLEVHFWARLRPQLEPSLRTVVDVDDLLQETATNAWKHLGGFEYRGAGSLLAWTREILARVLHERLDYWRAAKRHPRKERMLATTASTNAPPRALVDPSPGPSSSIAMVERRRRVAAALAALPERWYTLLHLRFLGGAEWSEIAEAIGSPTADAARIECTQRALPAFAQAFARVRASPDSGE